MNNCYEISDAIDIIREQLNNNGKVSFVPKGISMKPMLSGNDKVILEKPKGKLKKYDLPLYLRNGNYIIHRIIKVHKDGTYTACGDNNLFWEKGIEDKDIVAVVTCYYKNSKEKSVNNLSYKIYCRYINFIRPLRKIYHKFKLKKV